MIRQETIRVLKNKVMELNKRKDIYAVYDEDLLLHVIYFDSIDSIAIKKKGCSYILNFKKYNVLIAKIEFKSKIELNKEYVKAMDKFNTYKKEKQNEIL